MEKKSWFEREEDWLLKRPVIFNRNLTRLTFLELDRLFKLVEPLEPKAKILDLCCGIGRHTIELAGKGFTMTGVDITRPYLEIAAAKAQKEGLDIEFVHADMREFCRSEIYDVVINLCTSFGYFEDINDDIKVLQNIYHSLRPGGRFVIEILGKEVIAATFRKYEELEFEGVKVRATSRILNDWTSLECKRLIMVDDAESEITAYHRLYSATELKEHLQNVGFNDLKVYGSFAGAPYDHEARSLIIISQK